METRFDWTIESSIDFLKNKGEVKIADDTWYIDQKFDSKANMKEQELIVQLGISCPKKAVNYQVDFHHKVSSFDFQDKF